MTLPYTGFVDISGASPATSAQNLSGATKKRRYRPIRSCLPCHERKLQCDRAHPCKKCTDRRTTEQCIYRPLIPPSLRHLTHPQSQSESEQGENEASDGPANEAEIQKLPTPVQSIQAAATLRQQVNPQQQSNLVNVIMAIGQLLTRGSAETNLPAEGAQNPSKFIAELSMCFPGPEQTAWLLKHFFDNSPVILLWPILHKTTFHKTPTQFHVESPSETNSALLTIVCLLSLQLLPEPAYDVALFPEDEIWSREDLKSRLYEFVSSLLSSFELLTQPKTGDIQSLLLFSIYLFNEGNCSGAFWSSGNAIRMAQLAQLHQHELVGVVEPPTAEFGRILWWSLFLLDRHQCYLFQHPYMIIEQHCQTPIPEAIHYFADRGGRLSDTLIDNGFLLVQIQWARLAGRVWDTCSSVDSTTGDLLCLEKALHDLESGLSLPFRMRDAPETARRGAAYFQGLVFSLRTCHIRARMLLKLHTKQLRYLPRSDCLQRVWDSVSKTCTELCQRILADLHLAQHTLPPSYLRWGELNLIAFEAALFLAAGVSVDKDVPERRLVESLSWITIAQSLLEKAPFHDFQARRSLKAIDALRNTVLAAAHPTSSLRLTPHLDLKFESVISVAGPVPSAVIDGLSPDDILSGVLPPLMGRPEVDLLNDENFVDRVQVFLGSCAVP